MRIPSIVSALTLGLGVGSAPAEETKIVFIAGDRSHASGEHEFRAGCLLLAEALNEESGLEVEALVLGTDWAKDKSKVEDADALVIYADASSGIADQWDYIDELMAKGTGLMLMHYAVHPSKEMADKYQRRWVGATMEDNYSVNPHWVAELKPMKDHPIARGVSETFESFDEFYYNMRFQEDRDEVMDLITAVPTRERMRRYINMWDWHGVEGLGKDQALMWGVKRDDGGRGVGFTGGHYHKNWALDDFRTVVLNAIVWTAGMDVPEGGVKSEPVTEDELNENLDTYDKPNPRLKLPDLDEIRKMPPAEIDESREQRP